MLRYGVNRAALSLFGDGFPAGTLIVNVAGSAAIGALAILFAGRSGSGAASLFFATGLLGGFTTFSAFSLDVVQLWQRGEGGLAVGYAIASVALSLGGVIAGMAAARALG